MWSLIYVGQNTIFSVTDSFHTSHSKQHRTFGDTKITDVLLLALFKSFFLRLSPFASSKQTLQLQVSTAQFQHCNIFPKELWNRSVCRANSIKLLFGGKKAYCGIVKIAKKDASCLCLEGTWGSILANCVTLSMFHQLPGLSLFACKMGRQWYLLCVGRTQWGCLCSVLRTVAGLEASWLHLRVSQWNITEGEMLPAGPNVVSQL